VVRRLLSRAAKGILEAAESVPAPQVGSLVNQASEIADDRPLTSCEFSPHGLLFATASVSGTVKIWDVPGLNKTLTIRAHDTRVTGPPPPPPRGYPGDSFPAEFVFNLLLDT